MPLVIRPRADADLPALGRALVEQQAASGYPHREPLPMAPEDFVARSGALATWTALLDDEPVGHVAVLPVRDPEVSLEPALSRLWMAGRGLPADRLAEIGVYFTAAHVRGRGVGAALDHLAEHELAPCLDVIPTGSAVDLYRRTGWREVGRTRPAWLDADAPDVVAMVLPTGS